MVYDQCVYVLPILDGINSSFFILNVGISKAKRYVKLFQNLMFQKFQSKKKKIGYGTKTAHPYRSNMSAAYGLTHTGVKFETLYTNS